LVAAPPQATIDAATNLGSGPEMGLCYASKNPSEKGIAGLQYELLPRQQLTAVRRSNIAT
jgi:hypothetical protein